MTRQIGFDFIRLQVPDLRRCRQAQPHLPAKKTITHLERAVLAGAHQQPRIRRPGQPVHGTDVAPKRSNELARPPLPDPHAVIPRGAGGPPPVRAEGHVGHLTLVAREACKRLELARARGGGRRRGGAGGEEGPEEEGVVV